MKVFFFAVITFLSFLFPSYSFASQEYIDPCIELAHCVREEWDVSAINYPFEEIKLIIENIPRTEIVEISNNYIHAESTSKWMKYIDDLEVSYLPDSNKLVIRSESRVGESDLGVNQKRVNLLKSHMF